MKYALFILSLLSPFISTAETWKVHAFSDNYSWLKISNPDNTRFWSLQWDVAWDLVFPSEADSGISTWDGSTWSPWSGYADTLTATTLDGCSIYSSGVLGPYPDYAGPFDEIVGAQGLLVGEYWIDFDPEGHSRISTTQPSDFGKWAWDGSINPSWTATKKGFAKGHNKQPLPSPK